MSDPLGLKWIFIGWRVQTHENWWSKYRILWAKCQNDCTKEIREVEAFYQQWRPIPINIPEIRSDMGLKPPSASDAINSTADLIDAITKSGKGTEKNKWDDKMKEDGQKCCDQIK
jgi:hypothetical protein